MHVEQHCRTLSPDDPHDPRQTRAQGAADLLQVAASAGLDVSRSRCGPDLKSFCT